MSGLESTGWVSKSAAEFADDIAADLRASSAFGPDVDTSGESLLGQLIGVVSTRLAEVHEAAGVVYASRDPRAASFAGLDATASLTGTTREAATKGTVTLTVNLNAGVTLPAGNVAHVDGQPANRWVTTAAATNSGGSPANVTVAAEAEAAGVQTANLGTITSIATPFTGWNSVTNAADAAPGAAAETDVELRARRARELTAGGTSPADAIRAALSRVPGVSMAEVEINDTDTDYTAAGGLPPHSVEAIVQGGTDAAVALALWQSKAGGIRSYGTTTTTVTSASGATRSVSFTRPSNVNVYACVQVAWDDGRYPGGAAIENAVAAVTTGQLAGAPLRRSDVFSAVRAVAGVTDCLEVLLARVVVVSVGSAARAAYSFNLAAQPREVLKLASSRVAIVRATS